MKKKVSYLQVRVNAPFKKVVDSYVEAIDTTASDLVRVALREYMQNHPVKPTLFAPEVSGGE